MRIAIMTTYSCDDPTNVAVLRPLARFYRARGHQTVILGRLSPFDRAAPAEINEGGGAILRLGLKTRIPLLRRSAMVAQAWRAFSRVDFVHLHLVGTRDPLIIMIWLLCAALKVPMGVSFQDYSNPSTRGYRFSGSSLWALRRMLARARWVTALTRFVAREVERDVPALAGRVKVVPNGHDPDEPVLTAPPRADGPFVFCAARLMTYKGIDLLLMAWKDVCDRVPEIRLTIAGPDHVHDHYHGLAERLGIANRVRFLGQVERPSLLALMRKSLFCVLPSRHEAFGIAALEAMAQGKALLATRVGGIPEFVTDGETGILVEPKSVSALREGLLTLLGDATLRDRLGERAAAAAAKYQWRAIADEYLALGTAGR